MAAEGVDANLRAELEQWTSDVCRALSDAKRLIILYPLAGRARAVGELSETLGMSQSNILAAPLGAA